MEGVAFHYFATGEAAVGVLDVDGFAHEGSAGYNPGENGGYDDEEEDYGKGVWYAFHWLLGFDGVLGCILV